MITEYDFLADTGKQGLDVHRGLWCRWFPALEDVHGRNMHHCDFVAGDLSIECKTDSYPQKNAIIEIAQNVPWSALGPWRAAAPSTIFWMDSRFSQWLRAYLVNHPEKAGLATANLPAKHVISYRYESGNTIYVLNTSRVRAYVRDNWNNLSITIPAPSRRYESYWGVVAAVLPLADIRPCIMHVQSVM